MESHDATQSFSTLGHPGRLAVFRLLMRFVPQGVRPTEIAEALGLKQNTLSHHLAELEQVGLIRVQRHGRSLFYNAELGAVSDLVGYLVNDCCRSRPEVGAPLGNADAPTPDRPRNVLFICSGNSARSIFAEAILRDVGRDRFAAFSAGTRPGSAVNPRAVAVLDRLHLNQSGLRSKHISEFGAPSGPAMDFVFTVCDMAAAEDGAPWPGQPMTAHWGIPDPAKATGTDHDKALAFDRAFADLSRRITAFTALPFAELDKVSLQCQLDTIGMT